MKKREKIQKAISACVILILLFMIGYSGLQILESTVFAPEAVEETKGSSKTVVRNGVSYYPRQDITVIMLLGIGESGPVRDSGSYNNTGEADMVALLLCDEKNEQIRLLNLNRDTMLEIPVLGFGGRQAGTVTGQLALAHTYGSGLEDSCENTRTAVSDFLNGIRIDHYISMNMDAISILNDAVGGVRVTVTDDFSAIDPEIPMGEHLLVGDQAITFVRSRKNLSDQLNVSRLQRQNAYLKAFLQAFQEKNRDTFVMSVYEQVAPYIVTDCSVNLISSMLQRYGEYPVDEILTLPGENRLGQEFYEFYTDEDALEELILEQFYAPK
jgi:LCP family protein required for cell wall assembly